MIRARCGYWPPVNSTRPSALVTGASSGVGRATALALAQSGYDLILLARSRSDLSSVDGECTAVGADVLVTEADVGDGDAVDAAFAAAIARFGRVDVVVHAAAAVVYGRFEDVPADVFDGAMRTNVIGTANVSRAALRSFRAQEGGHLVIIGSLLGKIAVPWLSGYVVGKWAVQALSRTLRIETSGAPGINVSSVTPGSVNTPAYLLAANYSGWEGRPPPPIVSPERVAGAVLKVLQRSRRDRPVGPLNGLIVAGFRMFPPVFDTIVTPLMRATGLARRALDATPGAVFAPTERPAAAHGIWSWWGGRR